MPNYSVALNRFINSDEFAEAIIIATKTKSEIQGSYNMIELSPDEAWKVIWLSSIDDSPIYTGRRLRIPALSAEEFQELRKEARTDETKQLAELLRKKDIINKKAEVLRNLLQSY
jgi:hypothetical protein